MPRATAAGLLAANLVSRQDYRHQRRMSATGLRLLDDRFMLCATITLRTFDYCHVPCPRFAEVPIYRRHMLPDPDIDREWAIYSKMNLCPSGCRQHSPVSGPGGEPRAE